MAINEYGIKNFTNEILKYFDKYENALKYESKIVNESLIEDPSCYNIVKGGNSREYCYGYGPPLYNKKTGKFTKAKNKKEYDQLWKTGNYRGHNEGKAPYKDSQRNKYSLFKNDPLINKNNLISIFKDKIHCRDKNNNFFMVEEDDPRLLNNKLRKSGSFEGHKMSDNHKFKIGKASSVHQKGIGNSQYGTCWITNEKESKKIFKGNLIPNGWRIGRKIKNSKSLS